MARHRPPLRPWSALPALVALLVGLTSVVAAPPASATPHHQAMVATLEADEPLDCADVRWAAERGLLLAAEVRALDDRGVGCPDTHYLGLLTQAVRGGLGCADLEWHAVRGLLDAAQAAHLEAVLGACELDDYAFLVTVLTSGGLRCEDVTWHEAQGNVTAAQAGWLRDALRAGGAACAEPLRIGDEGQDVLALESRLQALGYWLGEADGRYDTLTRQAVYAFEKAGGRPVDGVADPTDQEALAAAARPAPSFPDPDYVEVDKGRQLLLVVRGGQVQWVFNTSTGTEERYRHPTSGWQWADTPPGHHRVDWHVDGTSAGELGPLYRPKFFHHDGIAVHGYHDVPPRPVSHGCVRVTYPAMDLIWAQGLMPLGSLVIVHGTTPGS